MDRPACDPSCTQNGCRGLARQHPFSRQQATLGKRKSKQARLLVVLAFDVPVAIPFAADVCRGIVLGRSCAFFFASLQDLSMDLRDILT